MSVYGATVAPSGAAVETNGGTAYLSAAAVFMNNDAAFPSNAVVFIYSGAVSINGAAGAVAEAGCIPTIDTFAPRKGSVFPITSSQT